MKIEQQILLKRTIYITSIMILFLLSILILFYVPNSLSYFSHSDQKDTDTKVGTVSTQITPSSTTSFIYDGSPIICPMTITNTSDLTVYTRITPFIRWEAYLSDPSTMTIVESEQYILSDDGWYYIPSSIAPSASHSFTIRLDSIPIEYLGKTVSIDLYVESVQSSHNAYQDTFPTAPPQWIEAITQPSTQA